MGQTVRIHADVAFDARYPLAAVEALLFGGVRVLDASRVNDQKSGVGVPTNALSDLANHIFLKLPPEGCPRPRFSRSIFANSHGISAIWESQTAASAIGIRS